MIETRRYSITQSVGAVRIVNKKIDRLVIKASPNNTDVVYIFPEEVDYYYLDYKGYKLYPGDQKEIYNVESLYAYTPSTESQEIVCIYEYKYIEPSVTIRYPRELSLVKTGSKSIYGVSMVSTPRTVYGVGIRSLGDEQYGAIERYEDGEYVEGIWLEGYGYPLTVYTRAIYFPEAIKHYPEHPEYYHALGKYVYFGGGDYSQRFVLAFPFDNPTKTKMVFYCTKTDYGDHASEIVGDWYRAYAYLDIYWYNNWWLVGSVVFVKGNKRKGLVEPIDAPTPWTEKGYVDPSGVLPDVDPTRFHYDVINFDWYHFPQVAGDSFTESFIWSVFETKIGSTYYRAVGQHMPVGSTTTVLDDGYNIIFRLISFRDKDHLGYIRIDGKRLHFNYMKRATGKGVYEIIKYRFVMPFEIVKASMPGYYGKDYGMIAVLDEEGYVDVLFFEKYGKRCYYVRLAQANDIKEYSNPCIDYFMKNLYVETDEGIKKFTIKEWGMLIRTNYIQYERIAIE